MPGKQERVALSAMLAADVEIGSPEAVAIVRDLCTLPHGGAIAYNAVPLTPGKVWLERDGRVSLSEGVAITVRQLADLLEVLLLATGRPRGRLPGPLVITLARGLGQVDVPGFATLSAFDEALARFEHAPRRELLRSLFARWMTTRAAHADEAAAGRTPIAPPSAAPPIAQPPVAAPLARRERRLGGAWIAVLAAGSMAAGSGLALLLLRPAAPQPAATHVESVSPRPAPTATDAVPVAKDGARASKPPSRTRQPRPQQLVDSKTVDANALFSPSFASNGSAVFFHALGPDGSALKRADRGDGGGVLHVATIVDDGAKNYHVQLAPDGSAVAFDSDRDGERGVYTARPDGGGVTRVSGDGYASVPKWSPDSRQLIFARAEPHSPRVWNVWSLDLTSGLRRRLSSHAYGQTWPGAWFRDGRRVCYSHEDRLIVLDVTTGRQSIHQSPIPNRLVRTPAVSPDGRWVMFQLFRDGGWLLDLSDGSMQRVLEDSSAEEFTWSPDGGRVAFHSRRSGQWGLWVMAPR